MNSHCNIICMMSCCTELGIFLLATSCLYPQACDSVCVSIAGKLESAERWQSEGHDGEAGPASAPHSGAHHGPPAFLLHHCWPNLWPGELPSYYTIALLVLGQCSGSAFLANVAQSSRKRCIALQWGDQKKLCSEAHWCWSCALS